MNALVDLGRELIAADYRFVTVSPETHRRVNARARAAGRGDGESLRDVFGWSRPFALDRLPGRIVELARAAGILEQEARGLFRSRVRFSTLEGRLFVHSAFPTSAADAVFFGPDTYRYCALVAAEVSRAGHVRRVVDIGCGSGAGGIALGDVADRVVLADVSPAALELARVNTALAGLEEKVEIVRSDVLDGVTGPIDLVIANPPYMADPMQRAYRDGGGDFGEALGVRIVRESLHRLEHGGRLVLYTGAAVVDGVDTFHAAVRDVCDASRAQWTYREIDPDVFGDEIEENDAYAKVERIAAVALVATVRRADRRLHWIGDR